VSRGTVDSLTHAVTEQTGRLESPAEAAAVLESIGLGDADAAAMGYENVFLLALEVYEHQFGDEDARMRRAEVEARYRSEEL
jgi:hypothetical protein